MKTEDHRVFPKPEKPMPEVDYIPIDKRQSEVMFTAPRRESKWAAVVGTLLSGQAVFIPDLTRNSLESLRSIINYRKYGILRSRWTEMDGREGRLLRIQRHGGK